MVETEDAGPEWARMTVRDLAELADGFNAFSKSGLAALCEMAGIDADGTASDMRAALLGSIGDDE